MLFLWNNLSMSSKFMDIVKAVDNALYSSGLLSSKAVLEYLKTSDIPVLACLSCDPATQARDVSFLTKHGYKITGTWLLDFYPNTSHIESLVILRK